MRPLRAFPFPINVGTDICQISRISRILQSPRATRFVQRILTPDEERQAASRLAPLRPKSITAGTDSARADTPGQVLGGVVKRGRDDAELWKAAAFIAGRFAAKEAAIKAHSHRRLTFHDITIERRRGDQERRLGSGPPIARIRGLAGEECDASAMISISHDGDYATATCLGFDPSVVEGGKEA